MPHPSFAELSQSLAELSRSLVQQVESMNLTLVAAVEASRKESDDLVKKNQALQAALLAKASEAGAAAAAASRAPAAKPRSFAEHLAGGVVKLTVFNRELYVHRSILSSIPFFKAKLEHWSDETVKLPEEITQPAFDNLLMRMYVGAPLPAGDVALCAQVIQLAKYWLLDAIATEMIAEILQIAKKKDAPVLDELAKKYNIPELSAAVEKPQRAMLCSSQDLEHLVSQALTAREERPQKLCTALLTEHPNASHILREQLARGTLFVWRTVTGSIDVDHHVEPSPGFRWFWLELRKAGLLKTELPFISRTFMSRLNQSTGYRLSQVDHWSYSDDPMPITYASALDARGTLRSIVGPVSDIMNSAANRLRSGSLRPVDLKNLLTSMPKCLLCDDVVDANMAKFITDFLPPTAREVSQMTMGRIMDVGPKMAAALEEIGGVGDA